MFDDLVDLQKRYLARTSREGAIRADIRLSVVNRVVRVVRVVGKTRVCLAAPASAILLNACSAPMASDVTQYSCKHGRSFIVQRDEDGASVLYADARYRLSRRPSSAGIKYASPEATLIIDGDFAALAGETIVELRACHATS